jgi:hypothetical protein
VSYRSRPRKPILMEIETMSRNEYYIRKFL